MPLLDDRIRLVKEAGRTLSEVRVFFNPGQRPVAHPAWQSFDGSFHNLLLSVSTDEGQTIDALTLAQRVVDTFPVFRDEHIHPLVGRGALWLHPVLFFYVDMCIDAPITPTISQAVETATDTCRRALGCSLVREGR